MDGLATFGTLMVIEGDVAPLIFAIADVPDTGGGGLPLPELPPPQPTKNVAAAHHDDYAYYEHPLLSLHP